MSLFNECHNQVSLDLPSNKSHILKTILFYKTNNIIIDMPHEYKILNQNHDTNIV